MWLILVTLPFFLIPSCLYTSQLCRFLGRNKSGLSCRAPKSGEAGHILLSFSGQRELVIVGQFLCQSGVWDDANKMKLFFLPFLYSYSHFCSIMLLKFLTELSNCWSLWRDGGWGLLLCHFGLFPPVSKCISLFGFRENIISYFLLNWPLLNSFLCLLPLFHL